MGSLTWHLGKLLYVPHEAPALRRASCPLAPPAAHVSGQETAPVGLQRDLDPAACLQRAELMCAAGGQEPP